MKKVEKRSEKKHNTFEKVYCGSTESPYGTTPATYDGAHLAAK